jgi:circadian clock protein KaiC
MVKRGKPVLTTLLTGVPGLDDVLGGGLPEYSFNLIAGEPGSGKTTLAHQIMFANAASGRRSLYLTILGEPALKMLRYLQQMAFFDPAQVGDTIHFVDLSPEVLRRDLSKVLERIVEHVEEVKMPGLHTFRIAADGLHVFPRVFKRMPEITKVEPGSRARVGVPGLDELLHGGIPRGDTVLVAGPSGAGKTCLSTHFVASGSEEEPAVLVVFEEHPEDYIRRAKEMSFDLERPVREGKLKVISLRPLDLSVDETLQEVRHTVEAMGARRLVIDSLTGFELALAPTFREDFRESLYRMLGALSGAGVTIFMTVEVVEAFDELRFSPHEVSFLTENLFMLRYAEIDGELKKVFAIVKMRKSGHSVQLHEFEITPRGMVIKGPLTHYHGILTGAPRLRDAPRRLPYPGLTDEESMVLKILLDSREATEEAVAAATGLKGPSLSRALSRLVALSYAIKVVEKGRALYRPLARALGQ